MSKEARKVISLIIEYKLQAALSSKTGYEKLNHVQKEYPAFSSYPNALAGCPLSLS